MREKELTRKTEINDIFVHGLRMYVTIHWPNYKFEIRIDLVISYIKHSLIPYYWSNSFQTYCKDWIALKIIMK